MKLYVLTATAFLIATGAPAFGQDATTTTPAPQETVGVATIDPATVATGWRATKIIGTTVVNENDESIGEVDDLILTADERVPYAILSVGGFIGIGTKLVAVPYSSLDTTQKGKTILPGATKDSLTAEPEFKYTNN